MLSTLVWVIALSLLGPEDIEVRTGTLWSLPKEFGGPKTVRLCGMQESSQLAIRCQARIASEKYLEMRKGLDLDFEPVKAVGGATQAVVVSFTKFTGDLAFREQNTYLYDSLLRAGLAKINQRDFAHLGKWVAKEFALAQEDARIQGLGMWAKQEGRACPYDDLSITFQAELQKISPPEGLMLDSGEEKEGPRYVKARLYGIKPCRSKSALKKIENYLRMPEGPESVRQVVLLFDVRTVDADGTLAVVVRHISAYGAGDAHEAHELNATSGIIAQGFGKLNEKEVADLPPKLQAEFKNSERLARQDRRGLWGRSY